MNKEKIRKLVELIIEQHSLEREEVKQIEEIHKDNPYAGRKGWESDYRERLNEIKAEIDKL